MNTFKSKYTEDSLYEFAQTLSLRSLERWQHQMEWGRVPECRFGELWMDKFIEKYSSGSEDSDNPNNPLINYKNLLDF